MFPPCRAYSRTRNWVKHLQKGSCSRGSEQFSATRPFATQVESGFSNDVARKAPPFRTVGTKDPSRLSAERPARSQGQSNESGTIKSPAHESGATPASSSSSSSSFVYKKRAPNVRRLLELDPDISCYKLAQRWQDQMVDGAWFVPSDFHLVLEKLMDKTSFMSFGERQTQPLS